MAKKPQKKIRNWSEYNKSLVKRGQILLSFEDGYVERLYYKDAQHRGGQRIYTSEMYEYLLSIKVMFRLPWRAATGFAKALLENAFADKPLQVPDYTHASREAARLKLQVRPLGLNPNNGLEIAFDSTGLNVYSTSGYHQRRYGKEGLQRKGNQWKKVHLALELNSMQILSMAYTPSTVNDCEAVPELIDAVKGKINSARADGAYDTFECYQVLDARGAQIIIPPDVTCKAQDELKKVPKEKKAFLEQRDATIHFIREHDSFDKGLKQWKIESGYHRRSLIEATMFRLKRIFGFHLQNKTEQARKNELIAKINLLNQMAPLGKAAYFD